MKFTVDRAKWRCGRDGAHAHGKGFATSLRNAQGMCCCLGFVSEQCGVSKRDTLHMTFPFRIARSKNIPVIGILLAGNFGGGFSQTALANQAASINDEPMLTRPEREDLLASLFAKHGHTVEFVGRYSDEPDQPTPVQKPRLGFVEAALSVAK